jgi:hypothetical protein
MRTSRCHTLGIRRNVAVLIMATLIGLLVLSQGSQAAEFTCVAGDVACLIDAIHTANANGEENTITLAAGTYTLTALDNNTDGPNGLPSITGPLTIQGAGPGATVIERASTAASFRLLHVAGGGTLALEGLTCKAALPQTARAVPYTTAARSPSLTAA